MNKRQIVKQAVKGHKPPYVPWHCSFTCEAREKLVRHYGTEYLDSVLGNHFLDLGNGIGFFEEINPDTFKDVFGVVWDRTVDKDIGIVAGTVLPQPTLKNYSFPDPLDTRFFSDIESRIAGSPDAYRRFLLGFSLYERAWTLRGMENLLVDFYVHPEFVRELLRAIADYNIAQIRHALTFDIDAVCFGDDWGQQNGLQMGPVLWKEFLYPELARMYKIVKDAGKHVFIHSCGDVDELFDDLVEIGVDCFNPFQPEVMDVFGLMSTYKGRLAFHGGMSTQKILPYGSVSDVKHETRRLLKAGNQGGYIFAPAHAVESDVSLENMLAFIETLHEQEEFPGVPRRDFVRAAVKI